MTLNRGLLNWGVFMIVLGAVPLAVYWNVIDPASAGMLIRLWPLILIGIGLGLLLRFTPFAALGGVVVAATIGLLIGAVLAGGIAGFGGFAGACLSPGRADAAASETRTSPFAGDQARLDLELTCAELSVDRAGGNDWIVTADFSNGQPSLQSEPARLVLRDNVGGPFEPAPANRRIRVSLPSAPAAVTYFTLNASSAELDLGGAALNLFGGTFNASDVTIRLTDADMRGGPLNLTLNASSGTVSLPRSGIGAPGTVSLNAASLALCAAPETALRLTLDERLSSNDFGAAGLARAGDTWQTPDFDAASERVSLNISANVSSITLDRSGGCP